MKKVKVKIGYPTINLQIGCRASRTFRLNSFSEARFLETVEGNLDCLLKILQFNLTHGALFFRISSDLIPFASHPVCDIDWQKRFSSSFRKIGRFIKRGKIRISMHPDQFVLINAMDPRIRDQSIRELAYHADVLDGMGLDAASKIQVHVGAAYGEKMKSMERFLRVHAGLDERIRSRLVIENDDRIYSVEECLWVHVRSGIPVLLDTFHHRLNGKGEPLGETLRSCARTWRRADGPLMVDYSSQEPGSRAGAHARSIDLEDFEKFLQVARGLNLDMDVMLEIKDKEESALKAIRVLHQPG